jgi:hypothetical protein
MTDDDELEKRISAALRADGERVQAPAGDPWLRQQQRWTRRKARRRYLLPVAAAIAVLLIATATVLLIHRDRHQDNAAPPPIGNSTSAPPSEISSPDTTTPTTAASSVAPASRTTAPSRSTATPRTSTAATKPSASGTTTPPYAGLCGKPLPAPGTRKDLSVTITATTQSWAATLTNSGKVRLLFFLSGPELDAGWAVLNHDGIVTAYGTPFSAADFSYHVLPIDPGKSAQLTMPGFVHPCPDMSAPMPGAIELQAVFHTESDPANTTLLGPYPAVIDSTGAVTPR